MASYTLDGLTVILPRKCADYRALIDGAYRGAWIVYDSPTRTLCAWYEELPGDVPGSLGWRIDPRARLRDVRSAIRKAAILIAAGCADQVDGAIDLAGASVRATKIRLAGRRD